MSEPSSVVAGSTVSWTRSSADYGAADGYSLEYTFFNQDATWSVSGAAVVASGNQWTATIASTAWASVPAGTYRWIARAVLGSVKVVIAEGTLLVRKDPADGPYDGRTFARRALDAVEAVIDNRATEDHISMSIAGRSISLMSPEELLRVRNALRTEVRDEENTERLRDGRPSSDIIRVRFTPRR